jgi:5-methyltetrahydropteroyltriglutamate--homocysteine methyltransferase
MQRSTSRILTTHAGSLPRPIALDDALEQRAADQTAYTEMLARSVGEVVRKQVDLGVDIVNDGELGKSGWTTYVSDRLAGFEPRPIEPGQTLLAAGQDRAMFLDFYEEATRQGSLWYRPDSRLRTPSAPMQWVCTGPITYIGQAVLQQDIENFRAALDGLEFAEARVEEAFMPVAAPASIEPGRRNEHYPSDEAYVYALAEAMREEYEAIVQAGFLLQIDDAWITALWDRMLPNVDVEQYTRYCTLRIDALNHALRNIPEDRVRYHICWGSWHGPHATDIPMKEVVRLMLRVNAGAYVFEAANVRHEHEYHVWEDVALPHGKLIVPGVVSHATNVLEHPELVAERITRFALRVGKENVLAGTDCGLGGRVHPQLAWAKLGVLAEGARLATTNLRFA